MLKIALKKFKRNYFGIFQIAGPPPPLLGTHLYKYIFKSFAN